MRSLQVSSGAVRRVIEIGTGTGLVSLAAVASGAECVIATDYNPATLDILNQAAELNFEVDSDVNSKSSTGKLRHRSVLSTTLFDVTDMDAEIPPWPAPISTYSSDAKINSEWVEMDCPCSDFDDTPSSESGDNDSADEKNICDLLVCADLLYTPRTARALAQRCATLLKEPASGAAATTMPIATSIRDPSQRPWRILVGDCGRPGAGAFVDELQRLGLLSASSSQEYKTASSGNEQKLAGFRPVAARTLIGERHDLIATEHEDEKPLTVGVIELGPWS